MNADDLRAVVEAATLAPSVHNTQPWRFAAGDEWIDVYADRERALGVVDPTSRELHISCGAAIAFGVVAVRELGQECSVQLLPSPGEPDHLARLSIGGPKPPSDDDERLARALPIRYTDRGRFDDRPVPDSLVAELRRLAGESGAWVRVLDRPSGVTVAVLLAKADDLERGTPGYQHELASWTRDRSDAGDGITPAAIAEEATGTRGSSVRLRDFGQAGRPAEPAGASAGSQPRPEHPLLLVLGTDGDDPRAWLVAGQALGRVLLRAALDGVMASPLTQVLEVPATRTMLARELRFVGHPQMLLRMGYGHGHPVTRRRSVDDVLSIPGPRESDPAPRSGRS